MVLFKRFFIKNMIFFMWGLSIGIVISCFAFITLSKLNQSKKITIKVSSRFQDNTHLEYRTLYDCNEKLKKNFKNEGKFAWHDSLSSINAFLSIPENMCYWDTYVIDSSSYELLVVQIYLDSHKKYFLLTNERIYDLERIPLTIKFDTLIYKKVKDNRWIREK